MIHAFLLVLDSYIPRLLLRYHLQGIFKALDEENWEDDSISDLHVYFLYPNHPVMIYLKRSLSRFFETYAGGRPTHFHLTTRNQLYNLKNGNIEKIKWTTISSDDGEY